MGLRVWQKSERFKVPPFKVTPVGTEFVLTLTCREKDLLQIKIERPTDSPGIGIMKLAAKTAIFVIIAISLLLGCAYQRRVALPSVGLPNEIFSTPGTNSYGTARVGVFAFSGPDYAPDMGPIASQILCNELQKTRAFREVISQPAILNMTMRNVINVARIKRYDLIITGRLLHYFEGTALEASSVSEEIRVIRVRGGKPRVLWHAKASETVSPVPSRDFIFFLSEGKPAPSPATLMRINAEKFCKMILTLPPPE